MLNTPGINTPGINTSTNRYRRGLIYQVPGQSGTMPNTRRAGDVVRALSTRIQIRRDDAKQRRFEARANCAGRHLADYDDLGWLTMNRRTRVFR
ncbi:MAG: hypothetical protein HKN26_11125 [Acidimicrobiales bacterium]|nr:hypothetical protein [Acidimicrobiales bacterium]